MVSHWTLFGPVSIQNTVTLAREIDSFYWTPKFEGCNHSHSNQTHWVEQGFSSQRKTETLFYQKKGTCILGKQNLWRPSLLQTQKVYGLKTRKLWKISPNDLHGLLWRKWWRFECICAGHGRLNKNKTKTNQDKRQIYFRNCSVFLMAPVFTAAWVLASSQLRN